MFAGTATIDGVTVPVRSMKSGLDAASLSITRDPASVLNGADDDPGET